MVRPIQVTEVDLATANFICRTYGSECDGAFAQYSIALSTDALLVQSDMSDVELATFPCADTKAEGMLDRSRVGSEIFLVTGASGAVSSASVQLTNRRNGVKCEVSRC
jgi:NADPH:quinone reductase-like Zn-dependent oxidoreductase